MLIWREERFGGILYDTATMGFRLLGKPERPAAGRIGKLIPFKNLHDRKDIISAPVQVYIEFTTKCNLKCKHCFARSGAVKNDDISAAAWFELLKELHAAGVINVRFTGGEPTSRSDWYEVLAFAKKLGFVVSLQTNGVYENMADTVGKIAKLELDQVTISVDGTAARYEEFRGSAFERLEKTVKQMRDAGIALRFNTILTKKNTGDLSGIFDFAGKYGIAINLFYMRFLGRGIKFREYSLTFEEHYKLAETIRSLSLAHPRLHVSYSGCFPGNAVKSGAGIPVVTYPYGNTALSISADGGFWPHHYSIYQSEKFRLGGYGKDKITDIWSGSKKLDGFRKWLGVLLERCENCAEYKRRCAGLNFEMEVEKFLKRAPDNPFCVNPQEACEPWRYLEDQI